MTAPAQPEITLHWLETSRADRQLWILEELGLTYKTKSYARVDGLAPESLKAIHPLGKSPLITIKEADGTAKVLAESGFIAEYLGTKYGGVEKGIFNPSNWDQKYWLHYTEGSLMPFASFGFVLNKALDKAPFFIKPVIGVVFGKIRSFYLDPNARNMQKYLEETLKKNGGYLVDGKFSLADALLAWTVEISMDRSAWVKEGEVWDWINRLKEREAYKRAQARAKELNEELKKSRQ